MILKKIRGQKSLALLLLRLEMAILFVFLVIFLWQYFSERKIDPILANSYYRELAEYIIASFVIAIGSALFVDWLEKETNRHDS